MISCTKSDRPSNGCSLDFHVFFLSSQRQIGIFQIVLALRHAHRTFEDQVSSICLPLYTLTDYLHISHQILLHVAAADQATEAHTKLFEGKSEIRNKKVFVWRYQCALMGYSIFYLGGIVEKGRKRSTKRQDDVTPHGIGQSGRFGGSLSV